MALERRVSRLLFIALIDMNDDEEYKLNRSRHWTSISSRSLAFESIEFSKGIESHN